MRKSFHPDLEDPFITEFKPLPEDLGDGTKG
jgi:hypothetical protein